MAASKMQDRLAYMIASINRQLENELEERLRPGGVPVDQFRILEVLDASEPCAMGEIASQSLIEPPTLTKIVDKMVGDGLVYRAAFRRIVIVEAAGRKSFPLARTGLWTGRSRDCQLDVRPPSCALPASGSKDEEGR